MRRRPVLVPLAVGVVAVLAWYLLLWQPGGADLSAARARQVAANAKATELQAKVVELQTALGEGSSLAARVDGLRRAVPDTPELAQFLLDTNHAANATGVQLLALTPSPPAAPKAGGPTTVEFALDAQGGYYHVVDFVQALLHLPRLVVLDTVSATADPAGALKLSLRGRTFTTQAPPAPVIPAVAAAPAPATTTGTVAP